MMARRLSTGLAISALALTLLAPSSPAVARGPGGWTDVGGGLGDRVNALTTDAAGRLVVAGQFTEAGGVAAADRIASWDGSRWRAYGPDGSIPGAVNDVVVHDGKVYVAGTFQNAGGDAAADNLAVWTGTVWQSFCATLGGPAYALEVVGDTLFVGGSFVDAGGQAANDGLIACDLVDGVLDAPVIPADGQGGSVRALVKDSNGALYVGGSFINFAGILAADYIVKYTGSFSALGSGSGPGGGAIDTVNVDALAADGTDIYVGTDDTDVADIPQADFVVKWDGAAWSALGADTAGTDGYIPDTPATEIGALLVVDGNLYATGRWIDADGEMVADNVGAFADGTWRTLGSNGSGNGPWLSTGYALAAWRGALVAGGGFVDAGGDPDADRLAAYPPADTVRPTTRIVARPAATVRTSKPKAKVAYKFRGGESGFWPSLPLRFQCKVDSGPYKPCTTPYTFRVGPGQHSFKVRAIDGAGNVDGSAAGDTFKVVRR